MATSVASASKCSGAGADEPGGAGGTLMGCDGTVPAMADTASVAPAVDLRSDTVTRPTPAMRRAMAAAEVGDDGFGDDPTVNHCSNATRSLRARRRPCSCRRAPWPTRWPCGRSPRPGRSWSPGGASTSSPTRAGPSGSTRWRSLHVLDDDDGTLDPAAVAHLVAGAAHGWPQPAVVCVENTHLASGGRPWPLDRLEAVAGVGVPVHPGRRPPVQRGGGHRDQRGGALGRRHHRDVLPVQGPRRPGGIAAGRPGRRDRPGSAERKRLGGGMRQVGILAAAGLVALDTMVDRLAEDHRRARRLAEAVAERWPDAAATRPRCRRTWCCSATTIR